MPPYFVAAGFGNSKIVCRILLCLHGLIKVALPRLLVIALAAASWLLAALKNGWLDSDTVADWAGQFSGYEQKGVTEVSGIFATLTEKFGYFVGTSALEMAVLWSLPLALAINVWIFPPHLRFSLPLPFDFLKRGYQWLENAFASTPRNQYWWQSWRGKEWLALSVFGRSLLMPWRRNDYVVLVWEQLQNMSR